ncbi:MAG TPA: ABC-F family ATP-binding cassette domain-containing protein [Xanthobacteraceae bacterium]|nr:ABC-F family ATP-binding cassette domain-containing protein [Xanthobacteraceae bacterium]
MLVIDGLSLRVAGRLLIDNASAQIPTGARVGVVGRNGTGKTTLFRAIAGELAIEQGGIAVPKRARVGRLAQEAPGGRETLIEVVLAADRERSELMAAAEQTHDPHRIAEIHARLADIDAHAAPARAAAILAGLGFSESEQQQPCASFSGGWRMRVALAALLFSAPDLLLLDEPTNYLDLEGTLWLQDFLARYRHTVLVISHDRDLLDSAVGHILHLQGGKLTLYRGNYSSFARQYEERQALDRKRARHQEAERKRIEAFVARFKAKATKARQAQSRVKLLAKLKPVEAIVNDEVRDIEIPSPAKPLSPPIVAFDSVTVGYGDMPVLRRLSLRIDDDDRIALIGQNGNGKSTFAKLLASRLGAMDGKVTRAEKLDIGYFAQHQLDELKANETPYDHVRTLMPDAPESKVRARVGAIGFSGAAADAPVATLSGGEKARLLLGLATFSGPHLVILDEPTNHLDIDSRAALIEAINDYSGAVVLISHDRHLIETCADRLWLVADGTVAPFDGDLEDYRRKVLSDRSEAGRDRRSEPARPSRTEARRAAAERRAELAPLRQRITRAEAEIGRRTQELKELDAALARPTLYDDPARATGLAKARAEAAAALSAAESDWLAASTEYEAANSDGTA